MKVVYTLRHRAHHPEVEIEHSRVGPAVEIPERVEMIQMGLRADARFEFVAPEEWGIGPIEAVHDPGLVRFLRTAWEEYQQVHPHTREVVPDVFAMGSLRAGMDLGGAAPSEPQSIDARLGYWCYETTTPVTHGTFEAARASVDVALSAAQWVLNADTVAYGLCRPPGHHAARGLYGGYCFFNNAAITAEHLRRAGAARVSVLDVDYHHGNGTQQIFYDRPDVQYVSLHADPVRAYPYHTGFAEEQGTGRGAGFTANFPLPVGTDDRLYLETLERAIAAVSAFRPDILVVSLGLDTHADDPLGDFTVTTDGLAAAGAAIGALQLPTVVLQEGGYAIDGLGVNARTWLSALAGYENALRRT